MKTVAELIHEAGGVLPTRDLRSLGARPRDLTTAVRSGSVRRVRRGWYTTIEPRDPRFIALRVGGRLTGSSALKLLGAWTWAAQPPVTVSVPRNAARLRFVRRARTVYDPDEVTSRGSYWSVDPRDALARAVLEASFEEAVTLWDWALSSTIFTESDLAQVANRLPLDARHVIDWADAGSQSHIESVARVRLMQAGYSVTTQEPVGRRQAIDLVVNEVVGLEVDGRAFHAESFEYDRAKDLTIAIEGRTPLRISYDMVKNHWGRILRAIEQVVSQHRGGRLAPPPLPGLARLIRPRGRRTWRLAA
jgi:very-short-patch-repair endonuclease